MTLLFDSNILIALRDNDPTILSRYQAVTTRGAMSIISRIELENGVVRDPFRSVKRREALVVLLEDFDILGFDAPEADIYRSIIAVTGYNRGRTLDRMIAATALRFGMIVVTANVRDFRDIPDLRIDDWSQ
jgi:tRNA(fMet)-specific endonuclease VapC